MSANRPPTGFGRIEFLEDRLTPTVDLSGTEQLLLELHNRARANPTAEAARFGIDLNEGLPAGTIASTPLPPLAPNDQLSAAVRGHLQYLQSIGDLTHTGSGGSGIGQRITAAGYNFRAAGENLAAISGSTDSPALAERVHSELFVDENVDGRGHRVNILSPNFREFGAGFNTARIRNFDFAIAGQDFGSRGGNPFLTGVAFTDAVTADDFYTVGEGLGGVTVTARATNGQTFSTTTGPAGGYSLQVPNGTYTVTFTTPTGEQSVRTVDVTGQNVKTDLNTNELIAPPPAPNPPAPPAPPAPNPPAPNPPGESSPPPRERPQLPAPPARPELIGTTTLVGGGDRGSGTVTTFNPDGTAQDSATPFPGFTGGLRTASADINSDGTPDVIVGTGPGRATRVVVLDGRDLDTPLFALDPFESAFTGGVYVASGDVTGDGRPDIIVTPDEGGGPRVRVFNGNGLTVVADFFGIDDTNFRGGARAAVGDLNGDGTGDVVVAAGFGGGPRVAGFDGTTLAGQRRKLFNDFFAFETGLRNGTFVAVGDVNADGRGDLIVGGGPGGGPRVTVLSGNELLANQQRVLSNFFGGSADSRGGARVSVKNLDNDAFADVIVGAGVGAGGRITGYLGKSLGATAPIALTVEATTGFAGGVFVG